MLPKKNIKIHLLVQKHHRDRCRQTQAFSLEFHKICKNSTFSKLVGVAIAMRLTLHFGVSQLLCHVCNGNVPRCGQIHRQLHLCRFHVMMFNFFVSIILYTSIQIGINLTSSSIKNKLLRLHSGFHFAKPARFSRSFDLAPHGIPKGHVRIWSANVAPGVASTCRGFTGL